MFDFGLAGLLYPKAITLYVTIAAVLLWQLYYCYRLKSRSERVLGTHHAPYIAYSACIIIWIGSNAYFHTDLLVNFGSEGGVFMAKLANLASFFSFAFAYYFSCQLLAEQKNRGTKRWQQLIFVLLSGYSLFINLRPDLTVENVSIQGPSEFVIEFGSQTAYFFNSILILITLTLINLARMRVNSSKLTLAKSNYMIAGILVFMLSTTAIHLGMTYFLGDFSLTWLPPALSISEMLFFGYALLTSRFYSAKYLAYIAVTTLLVCGIFVLPLGAVLMPITEGNQWLISIPICALIGVTWHWLYRRVSRLVSYFVYFKKQTPVQQILALEEDFKRSIDDAMEKLGVLLDIPKDKLQLVNSHCSETFYEDYLHSDKSVLLLDELSEEIKYTSANSSTLRKLYNKMRSSDTALVMPIYGHSRSVSHLLISSHKRNQKLFSNEEISALQTLLTRVQSTIEADRKVRQSRALAHSIAHEMRNPLTQVQLQFEVLTQHIESQFPPETLKGDINKGQAAIQRGRQLIDIILREVSDTSPEQEPQVATSIHNAVNQAITRYGFENEKSLDRVKLPQQDDFVVMLNETLFNFVIFNLIRNAVYYFDSYPASQIEMSTQTGPYENVLIFRDTGPGIDNTIVHKIFDDFFSYQKSGGSGLGLSYCQRVMRSFGGRIECHSVKGEFTEFYLYFPVVPNSPKAETFRVNSEHGSSAKDEAKSNVMKELKVGEHAPTVLIVDDKEVQRTLVQLYLKQLGVQCLQANNGANAIEMIQSHKVDLVLMDVQMPVMNGFDASQRIKAISPSVKVIALSGESGDLELAQISKLMDGRLNKPTTLNALREVIQTWLIQNQPTESNSL
ncbi:hybrid sensor histidine kinase/response regulator [Vibrio natriegens]|uniref:histidine kinase n=1 Tax=Vibrio natriegens NBRC 15636 = ATCC 14048 = DSM 759 TaxID=1219067 RepID=A0AAN0Y2R1_VIBNA|nr:hybrid sensor histidine kinase/response regulator [Vibrio natriegens]ALR15161.1 chemotaxis protein CheY [Vibrio natriegens NBRC 15636 = ATCC 14048 = DSM 759]ANQ12972.1 hybrid sensor histidine kinase/response regulator [Vibrio natriegens NBRC 15636 = ATCC 14048 = DSM 759]EPM39411.1 chemotaxis protein CheY [Vibrio natriegens NBRC 15636 = ATCC 14048 = DSM 759]MDX6027391.1 hybrid sensor histidine kinase/response regulator [Vibrio natriegens NBRC 15636 = ATCC 14048 = DSM 759]UUI10712.1 hybrid se